MVFTETKSVSPFLFSKGSNKSWLFIHGQFPGSSENSEEEPPSSGDGGHLLFWLLCGLPVWLHPRLSIRRHLPLHLHDCPRLAEAQERQEQGLACHHFWRLHTDSIELRHFRQMLPREHFGRKLEKRKWLRKLKRLNLDQLLSMANYVSFFLFILRGFILTKFSCNHYQLLPAHTLSNNTQLLVVYCGFD